MNILETLKKYRSEVNELRTLLRNIENKLETLEEKLRRLRGRLKKEYNISELGLEEEK